MTAEERARAIVQEDGGGDYYYEGWAQEDSIASAIRAAEDEALERAADVVRIGPSAVRAQIREWLAGRILALKSAPGGER